MRFARVGVLALLVACGGAQTPASSAHTTQDDALLRDPVLDEVLAEENARRASRSAKTVPASSGGQKETGKRSIGVRGITGSLNAFEVEQAMQKQSARLLACVEERPRALGHVAGEIAFHIDVDGAGKVERALVTQTDIGYARLEECLTAVVAASPLPAPAGAQRAETEWRMSVDPLQAPAEPLDSALLTETIAQHSEATYESCQIAKGRQFLVNGYLAQGKLRALSVRVPWRGPARAQEDASEQLSCLSAALTEWTHWPKAQGNAKVSFELSWVAAPPPPKKRGHARKKR